MYVGGAVYIAFLSRFFFMAEREKFPAVVLYCSLIEISIFSGKEVIYFLNETLFAL